MSARFQEPRPRGPRRVTGGLRLRSGGPAARTWVSMRFLSLLERMAAPEALREGMDYARRGQTVGLEIHGGRVEARVQGRAAAPYRVRWRLPVLDEAKWARVLALMAGEAFHEAKLRAGEVPAALEQVFGSLGLEALPAEGEVTVACDCGSRQPCKHAAAVGYLVTERLDDDPLSFFILRGMPQVLERLAEARALRGRGVAAAAPAEVDVEEEPGREAPADACPEAFWRPGPQLAELNRLPPARHAPHALLRRLGPSPLPGRFPLVGLLASVYDEVAAWAIRLRDRAERLG